MNIRTDGVVALPAFLVRFFMAPVALGAFIATITAVLHRRTHEPSVQWMSEEWLRNRPNDYRQDLP